MAGHRFGAGDAEMSDTGGQDRPPRRSSVQSGHYRTTNCRDKPERERHLPRRPTWTPSSAGQLTAVPSSGHPFG